MPPRRVARAGRAGGRGGNNTRTPARRSVPAVTSPTADDSASDDSSVVDDTPRSGGNQQTTNANQTANASQTTRNTIITLSPDPEPTAPTVNTSAPRVQPATPPSTATGTSIRAVVNEQILRPYQTVATSVQAFYWDNLEVHYRRWQQLSALQAPITITRDATSSGLRIVAQLHEIAQLAGRANTPNPDHRRWLGTSMILVSLQVAIRLGGYNAKVITDLSQSIQNPNEACDWYFAPLNPTNDHWVLVGYNTNEHHWFVVNSYRQPTGFTNGRRNLMAPDSGHDFREDVKSLRDRLAADRIQTSGVASSYQYRSYEQADQHSCGVILIANAVSLMIHGHVNTDIDPTVERLNCMERLTMLYQRSLIRALAAPSSTPATTQAVVGMAPAVTPTPNPIGTAQPLNTATTGPIRSLSPPAGRATLGSSPPAATAQQGTVPATLVEGTGGISTPQQTGSNAATQPASAASGPVVDDLQPSTRAAEWMLAGRDIHCHTLTINHSVWDRASRPPWVGHSGTATDTHVGTTTTDMPATQAPEEGSETIGGGPGVWSGDYMKEDFGSMCIGQLQVHARDAAMVSEGHRNKRQKRHVG